MRAHGNPVLTTIRVLNRAMSTRHKRRLFRQILRSQNPARVMQRVASALGTISSSLQSIKGKQSPPRCDSSARGPDGSPAEWMRWRQHLSKMRQWQRCAGHHLSSRGRVATKDHLPLEDITTSLCRTGPREAEPSGQLHSLYPGQGYRPSPASLVPALRLRPPSPRPPREGSGVSAPTAHAQEARACAPRRLRSF